MQSLYLIEAGPDRQRVLLLVKSELNLSLPEAKALVDADRPRLAVGSRVRIDQLRKRFEEAGAAVEVRHDPATVDRWIRPGLSRDNIHCAKCGSRLFRAVPGEVTGSEIAEFARGSRIDPTGEVARSGWIHPGVYCPKGCGFVMVNLDD
jgi:hypothetical protein